MFDHTDWFGRGFTNKLFGLKSGVSLFHKKTDSLCEDVFFFFFFFLFFFFFFFLFGFCFVLSCFVLLFCLSDNPQLGSIMCICVVIEDIYMCIHVETYLTKSRG